MAKYTQADFDALKRDEHGYLRLASGDWTEVDFGGADKLVFANWCALGNRCALGNGCKLGNWCTLGKGCTLGDDCALGNRCALDDGCTLGDGCALGNECTLGNDCKLGDGCTLGDRCALGNGCKLESGRVCNATYFKVSNIGSRNDSAYAYCDTQSGEIYVRAGCWFSGIAEFEARVREIHGGTQHEVDYLAFAAFARARFARYAKEGGK